MSQTPTMTVPAFRKRNALDYVIVSDAGKPFSIDEVLERVRSILDPGTDD